MGIKAFFGGSESGDSQGPTGEGVYARVLQLDGCSAGKQTELLAQSHAEGASSVDVLWRFFGVMASPLKKPASGRTARADVAASTLDS
jgi:hypothetical protein